MKTKYNLKLGPFAWAGYSAAAFGAGCLGIVVLLIGMFALEAWGLQALYNWLVVHFFEVQPITYTLAFGLTLVLNIIIGLVRGPVR